ncbi:hypothetical protein FQR65_LT12307 [Abscondita terminalis]|nr:hypothetical protein FQR65_LT12307 [Abscondita terminalis]
MALQDGATSHLKTSDYGKMTMDFSEGDGLVVSGVAGRFPESDNVYEYRDNLINKVDMVTSDCRRWKTSYSEIPQRLGKINFIEKFDSGFFGIHYHQIHAMDPVGRMLLEHSVEAVLDAGFHPDELKGTRTGVFTAACIAESEKSWFYKNLSSPNFGGSGSMRSMQPNWISHFFQFEGPSVSVDTACSSSLTAFDLACRSIRLGECDSAIVGSGNLCMHPMLSLQFFRLGVLSGNGSCKSFDKDADGYARSEAVSVVFLQKAKDARRIYAHVIHTKVNCDGFKEQGITFPSSQDQIQLLSELYQECNIDPTSIDFLEAHATGTKVGDPAEIAAMDYIYCRDRDSPLYVGSVKSNHGHTEPVSGLCSLIKVVLSMENDCFLPNISYANPGQEPLIKKRLVVVTEPMAWVKKSNLAAINNFGFGGANAHVLLKRPSKIKIRTPDDDLPRLVCFSGRTEKATHAFRDDLRQRSLDFEFVALLHTIFGKSIKGHIHRGFSIVSKEGELFTSNSVAFNNCPSLCLQLGGPSEEFLAYVKSIFKFPAFGGLMQRLQNFFANDFDVFELIAHNWQNSQVNYIAGSILAQVALIELFKTVELKLDEVRGFSSGSIAAAYANGSWTLEQVVIVLRHLLQTLREYGTSNVAYEVCLGKNVMRTILPNDFEIVTHNSDRSYVIQGPAEKAQQFSNHLQTRGVTMKRAEYLGVYLKHKEAISAALIEPLRQLLKSPEQFIDNLFITKAPELSFSRDSILVSTNTFSSDVPVLNLTPIAGTDQYFLATLGRLYELGANFRVEMLYPQVQWPVSAGTPMISPLIEWNHESNCFVAYFRVQENVETGESSIMFTSRQTEWAFVTGHVIDNRNLLPATGYLMLVWETFALLRESSISECNVVFQDVRFHRATNLTKDHSIKLFITIQRKTGIFEVAELGQVIVSGKVHHDVNLNNLPILNEESNDVRLSKKDIYKELKLRGYHYSGVFRGLESCSVDVAHGEIEWNGNWTAFMDNMLQIQILQVDTRGLYVPTYIDQLSIDTRLHSTLRDNSIVPVYVHKTAKIIRSGGVEIKGLKATPIAKRKSFGEPVLESYKFVPLVTELPLDIAVRIVAQIILENHHDFKFKAAEVLEDQVPVTPMLQQALGDLPLIQPELTILTKKSLTYEQVTVKNKKLSRDLGEHLLIVAPGVLSCAKVREEALDSIKPDGFVLAREHLNFDPQRLDLNIIAIYCTDQEKLILFQKDFSFKTAHAVDISDDFAWLPVLQGLIKDNQDVIVVSENDDASGVLGLVNCLRREPYAQKPKCVVVVDPKAPPYDPEHDFYLKQLRKGLCINVYKNGCWGTYRHIPIKQNVMVEREHIFNNVLTKGDLSSLRWLEGPLKTTTHAQPETTLVRIVYSAINFRDIMSASGRIHSDVITTSRIEQQILQGFEFSGITTKQVSHLISLFKGERVMGISKSGALASMIMSNSSLMMKVPDGWSIEDAATVSGTYCTSLVSLEMVGRIKPGQSILIHAGAGGIGMAAINIALYYKCQIFTTVGTAEKKKFILEHFPEIPESHIGNSRDSSFEQLVLKKTKGRGVDFVLNSLSEEKLFASVRCLAPGGKFLEIGKFDLQNNAKLQESVFAKGCSYHGVMLDAYFDEIPPRQALLLTMLRRGIDAGYVKPLKRTVFEKEEIEQAFRYMAGGKHIGKVLVKIRDSVEENVFKGISRFYCNEDSCSVIVGGLGGFGLELADWLVMRGCKKLVLVSRSGLKNGYQTSRILNWKTYGVVTKVSTADVTSENGCENLLEESTKLGPVECIFNLAVVLKDAVFENQSKSNFEDSFAPKATATKHLDAVSRRRCPRLKKFVVFSSVVCGRGNAGQSNYGMSNSVMERICERRRRDGFHALAVQWGAVGDVGLVADMQELHREIEIGGTLQQRITSCLDVMDTFLTQDEPIVSSMVVAEKKHNTSGSGSVINAVMNIIGVKDLKSVGVHTSLAHLGMDSIMAVEIKQTLEREYDCIVTPQEVRALTFAMLQEMECGSSQIATETNATKYDPKYDMLHLFILNVAEEIEEFAPIARLKSLVTKNASAPSIFFLPGIDGKRNVIEPLAAKLVGHVFCLQYDEIDPFECSVENTAELLLQNLQNHLQTTAPFIIIAYSLSCVIALHLVSLIENLGLTGRLILLDGSPSVFKQLVSSQIPDVTDDNIFESYVVGSFAKSYLSLDDALKITPDILECKNLEERIELAMKYMPNSSADFVNYQKRLLASGYGRIRSATFYKPNFEKLKTVSMLVKPDQPLLPDLPQDYDLQDLFESPIRIRTVEGNHLSILKNSKLATIVNEIVEESWKSFESKSGMMENSVIVQRESELKVKEI